MLPAQFDSPRSVSILFSSCEIRAPSVRYPSSFLVDSCSGACGIATTAGERVGLHIAIPGPSGIAGPKACHAARKPYPALRSPAQRLAFPTAPSPRSDAYKDPGRQPGNATFLAPKCGWYRRTRLDWALARRTRGSMCSGYPVFLLLLVCRHGSRVVC